MWGAATRFFAATKANGALDHDEDLDRQHSLVGKLFQGINQVEGEEENAAGVTSRLAEMLGIKPNEMEKPTDYCGKLKFNISYDFAQELFAIKVIEGRELPPKDTGGTSDPFVRIQLLPDKKQKAETTVKWKNLNPTWNETLMFQPFKYEKLQKRVLHLKVFDKDRFSKDDTIGEINIPICELDLTKSTEMIKDLNPISKERDQRGEVLFSLTYNPITGKLTVLIVKCRNLKAMDIGGLSDPYVKIWQLHDERRVEKRKTVCKDKELNPVYNEQFVFDVPFDKVKNTQFLVKVIDKDRLMRNDTIGEVIIGKRSGIVAMQHWKDMLSKPRVAVAYWHKLRL